MELADRLTSSGDVPPRTLRSAADEQRRQKIVIGVFVLFLLLLIEGVLRKWAFPQYSRYLFFVRDPVVLVVYAMALGRRSSRSVNPFLLVGLALGALMLPVALTQLVKGLAPDMGLLIAYGWRNYFLYLPLPFVIADNFDRADLQRLGRFSALALIAIAPLAVLQYLAPPGSAINVGSADDESLQFVNLGSARGHIRPPGTFTSGMGMVQLTCGTLAFLFAYWARSRRERPISQVVLLACTVAVAASMAVSGSRTMFIHAAIVVICALVCVPVLREGRVLARAAAVPVVLAAAFAVLYPVLFPEAYSTFVERWGQASASEHGIHNRMLATLLEFTWLLGDAPIGGYGLGLGGNAAHLLKASNTATVPYSETDWAHHIVDLGPVLGVVFIAYRVAFAAWLGREALRATRRQNDPIPFLLFGYVGVVLLMGQITGNGTVNGFCWLYVGFCLAACRPMSVDLGARRTMPPRGVSPRRPPNLMT